MVAAKDSVAGKRVAIKKIKDAVEDDSDGKRLLRELKVDTLGPDEGQQREVRVLNRVLR